MSIGLVPMCLLHTEGDQTISNSLSEIIETQRLDDSCLLNGVKSRLPMIEDPGPMEEFICDWLETL